MLRLSEGNRVREGPRAGMCWLLCLLWVLGCSSTTGIDSDLQFSVSGQRPFDPPSAIAEGGQASITVQGSLTVSEPCRRFRPTLKKDGFNVELLVAASRTSSNCPDAVVNFDYEAKIKELEPGTYQLTIKQTDLGVEQLRLVQSVSVT